MRNMIVWTLSFLLVFEPSIWAANRPTITELKAIIEYSELGKRSMTLNELYGRAYGFIPQQVRDQLEPMLDQYGDYQIPKFNVSKIKNTNGEEFYQLSAVKDGKSVTISLGESSKALVKINGQVIDGDMKDFKAMMAKAGVAKNDVKEIPAVKRNPAQVYILKSKQIDRLSKDQQKTYFKQLRGLLESMEAVEQAGAKTGKKTSSRTPASVETFAALLAGSPAMAVGKGAKEPCVAAGYVAEIRGTCGAGPDGNVDPKFRGKCTNPKQFVCNPVVYGDNGGCVNAGRDTTKQCNDRVNKSGKDIPDSYQNNKQAFETFRDAAMVQVESVQYACGRSVKGALKEDQKITCDNFQARVNEVKSWNCDESAFSTKYPKLCGGPDAPGPGGDQPPGSDNPPAPPGPGGDQPGSGNPPTPPAPGPGTGGGDQPADSSRYPKCDSLPNNISLNKTDSCSNGGTINSWCLQDDGSAKPAIKCICDNGKDVIGKMQCADNGKQDKADGKNDRHKKPKKKGPNWLLIFGAGLAGLLAFHWLSKAAVKQQFQNIDPIPAATPVPVDPVAPGAR